MAFLTTSCGECGNVGLEDEHRLLAGHLRCSGCGERVHVVPGCSFGEQDRTWFEELRQVVADRTIAPSEAKTLAVDIAGVLRATTDSRLLERLTERFPGLLPIQIAVGGNRLARQRTLRILRAIFEAKLHRA